MNYIAYYRVSTQEQKRSKLGLEGQKEIVKHFIGENKLIKEYTEIKSGKSIENRPILQQAIKEAKNTFSTLIVAKTDRLSRNLKEALIIYDELSGNVEFCDIPSKDRFTISICFSMAERERELIGIRTKIALNIKKKLNNNAKINGRKKGCNNKKEQELAVKTIKEKTKNHNKEIYYIIKNELEKNKSIKEITRVLNELEKKTQRGNTISQQFVNQFIKRIN